MSESKIPGNERSAIILCNDQRLRRLLEIELAQYGIALSPSEASADLWLLDLDDFPSPTSIQQDIPVLAWSRILSDELEDWAQKRTATLLLKRPFSLVDLEDSILRLCEHHFKHATLLGVSPGLSQATKPTPPQNAASSLLYPMGPQLVWAGGKQVNLTPHEWILFSLLWEHRGDVVSKEKLREALSAQVVTNENTASNTPEVYICLLRKKLEKPLFCRLITTVRGQGYRLDVPYPQNKNHKEIITDYEV